MKDLISIRIRNPKQYRYNGTAEKQQLFFDCITENMPFSMPTRILSFL